MVKKIILLSLIIILISCTVKHTEETGKVTGNKVVEQAKKYIGRPYKYGGTGNPGFDCSGFTQRVYADLGINIPRMTTDQSKTGKKIEKGSEKPGDLIFFNIQKKGKATHAAIIVGNGKMIHANSSGGSVRIVQYGGNSYWEKHFMVIRRII